MERLNYFHSYKSESSKENELTRAFLVLLRHVPLALGVFLDLVREGIDKKGNNNCSINISSDTEGFHFKTQVGSPLEDEVKGSMLVSVLMTDREWEQVETKPSGDAIYDGVISAPPDWTLIIENKPNVDHVDPSQITPKRLKQLEGDQFDVFPNVVQVHWGEVIDRLIRLINWEWFSASENRLIYDFMEYVNKLYPALGPFSSFTICKSNITRQKRCDTAIRSLAPSVDKVKPLIANEGNTLILEYHENSPLRKVFLWAKGSEEDWHISLSLYPADTIGQARNFYNKVYRDKFLDLTSKGWKIYPKFHLSYRGTHLHYPELKDWDLDEYADFWLSDEGKGLIRQFSIKEQEFKDTWSRLMNNKLITIEDKKELETKFDNTKRDHVNVIPGLKMEYIWKDGEAKKLDQQKEFENAVKEKIYEAFNTWGQDPNI